MKLIDLGLSLLVPGLVLVHLIAAPYSKAEESFNLQATHDVLVYGTPTSNIHEKLSSTYDHFTFPGAVPRTFIGPVLLAGLAQPIVHIIGFEHAQLVVRALLGLFNAWALLLLRRSLARTHGDPVGRWYLLLQASQFHIMFYASRTLPNMFAFALTTVAFAFLIPHPNHRQGSVQQKRAIAQKKRAIALLVFAAAIFRSEVAVLLATSALWLLITSHISLLGLITTFLVSFAMALVISIPIDSYFWQKPLWPELWGFYYNAVLGSSSNWGVSPWHYYFTSALPRLLLNPIVPLLLIPTALRMPATSRAAQNLVYPSLLFVAIYSLQPHKEARFIFYVVPPLTAAAALGANYLFSRRTKSTMMTLLVLVIVLSILASFAASTGMLLLSSLNYPGGEALNFLRNYVQSHTGDGAASPVVPVHADVLSCMTGVTLFGTAIGHAMPTLRGGNGTLVGVGARGGRSDVPTLALDKTEDDSLLEDTFWTRFDYLLMEEPALAKGGQWETIGVVQSYAGVEILKPDAGEPRDDALLVGNGAVISAWRRRVRSLTGGWWVGPRMEPRVYILRRAKELERVKQASS